MDQAEALQKAIKAAGGKSAVGRFVGVSPQAVDQWAIAPAKRVTKIEEACKKAVTRYQLRPDIYGEDPS